MPADDSYSTPPPLPAESKTWQFSLRTMMIAMTVLCLLCTVTVILPHQIAVALIRIAHGGIFIAASGCLIVGVWLGRGKAKAFCIGAGLVVASMWLDHGGMLMHGVHSLLTIVTSFFSDSTNYGSIQAKPWVQIFDMALLSALAVANGCLCVRAHRYFERHADD